MCKQTNKLINNHRQEKAGLSNRKLYVITICLHIFSYALRLKFSNLNLLWSSCVHDVTWFCVQPNVLNIYNYLLFTWHSCITAINRSTMCISLQIISIAFQRKSDVQQHRCGPAENRIPWEIPQHIENHGLCGLRQVSIVGKTTGAGSGDGAENPLLWKIRSQLGQNESNQKYKGKRESTLQTKTWRNCGAVQRIRPVRQYDDLICLLVCICHEWSAHSMQMGIRSDDVPYHVHRHSHIIRLRTAIPHNFFPFNSKQTIEEE